jgi:A/G-specific adenine glycosylase
MLQQTQVSRVERKYPEFLKRFPTLKKLAAASRADAIRAWQGMGYNRRAIRLRNLAERVATQCNGNLPHDVESLSSLPGIGRYTAHALASFAFGKNVPIVDVNVRRVLSRVFWRTKSLDDLRNERVVWDIAKHILPRKDATGWNQALMDFGATVCTARKPSCASCPLSVVCASSKTLIHADMKRKTAQRIPERLYGGVPVRIYRGRIVEELRRLNGDHEVGLPFLGKRIRPGFARNQEPWLRKIVRKLEADGLARITRRGSQLFVSLPQE